MAGYVETLGTLSNNTVSRAADLRQGIIIGNPSDTAMVVRFGGTASATQGIPLPAGSSLILTGADAPNQSVSVFCAGSSKAYAIYEW